MTVALTCISLLGLHQPATWMLWLMVVATLARYLHAAGMLLGPTLEKAHPLRAAGAGATYLCGFIMVIAILVV